MGISATSLRFSSSDLFAGRPRIGCFSPTLDTVCSSLQNTIRNLRSLPFHARRIVGSTCIYLVTRRHRFRSTSTWLTRTLDSSQTRHHRTPNHALKPMSLHTSPPSRFSADSCKVSHTTWMLGFYPSPWRFSPTFSCGLPPIVFSAERFPLPTGLFWRSWAMQVP